MGRIAAPYGVRGWLRIQPYTDTAQGLLAYPEWWVRGAGEWQKRAVEQAKTHGRAVVALLEGCADRDAALRLRGLDIAVPREQLPQAQANEYYWADLLGLEVVDGSGRNYGSIVQVLATGANDVLVVQGERERLIPFIADVVGEVDLEAGRMRVNWDADF
jgi:16S rRNA processing protein RimM